MQTGYQCCATLTGAPLAPRGTRAPGQQSRAFYKFNCAFMSANLRQPDAIWEPDCPVRRAQERDRGLPKEKQTRSVASSSAGDNCMIHAYAHIPICRERRRLSRRRGRCTKGFEGPPM